MVNRSRRVPPPAASPLRKAPVRPGPLNAAGLVAELRKLHEDGGDPAVERMPEDTELWGALEHAERHAPAVKDPTLRKNAALKRVELCEYLRQQIDLHQSRAVQDAREAGAQWAELVGPLAVGAPSGAYTKARRLLAAELSEKPEVGPLRRTPEAVTRVEAELAAAERATFREELRASLRHEATLRVARRLHAVREDLRRDDDADYWLEQIAAVVDDCRTPRQFASLAVYVTAALRHLRRWEEHTGRPAALTDTASEVLDAVAAWETASPEG